MYNFEINKQLVLNIELYTNFNVSSLNVLYLNALNSVNTKCRYICKVRGGYLLKESCDEILVETYKMGNSKLTNRIIY